MTQNDKRLKEKEAELIKLRNKIKMQRDDSQQSHPSSSQGSTKGDSMHFGDSQKPSNRQSVSPVSQQIPPSRQALNDTSPPIANMAQALPQHNQLPDGKQKASSKHDPGYAVQKLCQALKKASGSKLLICIKGYPDPDNIACSLALQWIARHFDIESTILHFEEISHHENRALVKKLDIDIEFYHSDMDLSRYEYFAINDSQNTELPIKLPEHCRLLAFVDHHRSLGTIQGEFIDIRESAGSTSAIYSEYLHNGPFEFTGESALETKIATALMHGIRSDTDNFINATPIDFSASEFLSLHVDKDLLGLISRQSVPAKTMDLTQIALQRKDIRGTFMFAGVGFVREEDRDGIGQCADYLLHREGIDTVVVYGVVGNLLIDGSLRTKSHTLDPDKWIKDVFGQNELGVYYGGGRKDKGGFQIPLGVFAKCTDKELLWILIKKTIDELFYEKIGIEENVNLDGELSVK